MRRLLARGLDGKMTAGLIALSSISTGLLIAVVSLFLNLVAHENRIEDSVREDAIWAAYQLNNEASQLQAAISAAQLRPSAETLMALNTRFDVLYSRASFLVEGRYAIKFDGASDLEDLSRRTHAAIMAMTPAYDRLAHARTATPQELEALAGSVASLKNLGTALLLATNTRINALRVQSRSEVKATSHALAYSVGGLVLAMAAIMALMGLQLRHIANARKEVESLNRRHILAAAQAEAGGRAKSTFLATMSHEIRTPLNGIIGLVDLLERDETDAAKRGKLAIVRQSGDMLLDIINDVLDYSKLEAGDLDLEKVDFTLADVMEPVRSLVGPRAERKLVSLSFDYPDIALSGDEARLRQVLFNLVGNAVKFTDQGSVRVSCELVGNHRLSFRVQDTGIGIAQDAIHRLFKEFSQVDSSINRRFGGSGLGLAICSRLVKALGGEIGVESTEGMGSLFWFDLPYTPAEATIIVEKPDDPEVLPVLSRRVLLAEDNMTNRRVALELLLKLGVAADVAVDGHKAVELAGTTKYDLVFMDMQMPVVDGLEATRRIRASGSAVPIVGLTANAFVSDREACLHSGMDDFMTKPITMAKLQAMVLKWSDGIVGDGTPVLPDQDLEFFDIAQQQSLAEELGSDMMLSLKVEFWSGLHHMLTSARQASRDGDLTQADHILHNLKGAAYTLGFKALGKEAQAARDTLREGGLLPDSLEKCAELTQKAEFESASWLSAAA